MERDGQLSQMFIDYLNHSIQKHAQRAFSMVLLLNLDEVRQISERALAFWKARETFCAWPVMDTGRFVPDKIAGGLRNRGGNIQQQRVAGQLGFDSRLGCLGNGVLSLRKRCGTECDTETGSRQHAR